MQLIQMVNEVGGDDRAVYSTPRGCHVVAKFQKYRPCH